MFDPTEKSVVKFSWLKHGRGRSLPKSSDAGVKLQRFKGHWPFEEGPRERRIPETQVLSEGDIYQKHRKNETGDGKN